MKPTIKIFLLLLISFASTSLFAQDAEKTVSLVVSAQGKTQDEAKQNALRSAIEQAFGTFISSKTELLNDSLIRDEIVSIANGNIQKYDIISEIKMPNGEYSSTLQAVVSISKLTSFCENKGVTVEFKGGLFVADIKQQMLNEKSELEVIKNLCKVSEQLLYNSFDFELSVLDPISIPNDSVNYLIPLTINYIHNDNISILFKNFTKTLDQLAMSNDEIKEYTSLKKPIQYIVYKDSSGQNMISLRNPKSAFYLKYFTIYSNRMLFDFKVVTDVDSFKIGFRKNASKDSTYNISNSNSKFVKFTSLDNEIDVWYLDSLNSILNFGGIDEYGEFTSGLFYYLYWNYNPRQFREEYNKMIDLNGFWNNWCKNGNLSENVCEHMVRSMIYDANRLYKNIYNWEVSSLSPEMERTNLLVLKQIDKIGSIYINHKLSIDKIEKLKDFKIKRVKNNSLL